MPVEWNWRTLNNGSRKELDTEMRKELNDIKMRKEVEDIKMRKELKDTEMRKEL